MYIFPPHFYPSGLFVYEFLNIKSKIHIKT